MPSVADFKLVQPSWKHFRMIHSKYPTENIFDEDDETNYILGLIEAETSDRCVNYLEFVSELDVCHGDGWGAVMASFCYPGHGRFSTCERGSYYCADSVETAIAEWAHHTANTWKEFGFTNDASATVRCYTGSFDQSLLDVRGYAPFHQHDNDYKYEVTNDFAAQVRNKNLYGIIFDSVRHAGGQCAALFRPPATTRVVQSAHFVAIFDGEKFTDFAEVGALRPI